jgi:hypothetical protein
MATPINSVPRPTRHPTDTLLDVARDLVVRDGARAVTVDRIIDSSGAPKGSIYHRFPRWTTCSRRCGYGRCGARKQRFWPNSRIWLIALTQRGIGSSEFTDIELVSDRCTARLDRQ